MTTGSTNSLRNSIDISNSKAQEKFVNDRVTEVEKNFGQLCGEFVAYTRRTAKLRDNGDNICRLLLLHSEHERFNKTTQLSLKKFVEHLATAEDYRDSEVTRLTQKVLDPLSAYGQECKHVRTNLKSAFMARKKEEEQRKKMERERSKDNDPSKLARSDLERASLDASKTSRELEKEILNFETKKLRGMKKILRDFVQIELLWHAKALEVYSKAFNDLQMMDEEEDLEDFRSSLLPEAAANRLSRHKFGGSQGSLQSTGSLGRGTLNSTGRSKPPVPANRANNGYNTGDSGLADRRHSYAGQSSSPEVKAKPHVRIQELSDDDDDDDEDEEDEYEYDDGEDDEEEVTDEEETDYDSTTATTPGRPVAAIINGRNAQAAPPRKRR